VLTTLAALGIKFLLIPLVTQDAPFQLFSLAVMVTSLFAGLGPGLLATALATLFNFYFFMQPFNAFRFGSPDQPPRLVLFIIESVCISVICDRLRVAQRRVEQRGREAQELQQRILEISEAEQRRIGHDLHDGLGQQLTALSLMAKRLVLRLEADGSARIRDATDLYDVSRSAVESSHDLCRSLSPPALDREGLQSALATLAANVEVLFGVQCTFVPDPGAEIREAKIAVHLYRIAQEAISNAVRHGHAKHVRIELTTRADGELRMAINDDGKGMPKPEIATVGMGLRIMQYRANVIGASLFIGSNSGTGTSVLCCFRPTGHERLQSTLGPNHAQPGPNIHPGS
jgi:signal transduction histidine kinase